MASLEFRTWAGPGNGHQRKRSQLFPSPACLPICKNPLAQAKVRRGLVPSWCSSNPLPSGQNSWSRKPGVISIWREKLPQHLDTSQLLFKISHQIYRIHVRIVSQPDFKKNVLYYPDFFANCNPTSSPSPTSHPGIT